MEKNLRLVESKWYEVIDPLYKVQVHYSSERSFFIDCAQALFQTTKSLLEFL